MQKAIMTVIIAVVFTMSFAVVSSATVPPPPVNQQEGIDDGVFNNLAEADCRFCHDLGNGPVDGICSVSGNACTVGDISTCVNDPVDEVCLPILAKNRHHLLVDGLIPSGSLLERPEISPPRWTDDADGDGLADTNYACENCHPDDPNTPIIEFPITRNCLVCHEQQPGVGSVHHISGTSPALQQVCTVCHGDIVDDTGDGHLIPTYNASLITPKTSQGNGPAGDPNDPNLANFGATNRGACDYCHSTGNRHGVCSNDPNEECSLVYDPLGGDCPVQPATCNPDPNGSHDPENPGTDATTLTMVYGNSVTHHNTGLPNFGAPPASQRCTWCHPDENEILIGQCSLTGTACTSEAQCAVGETCNFVQEIRTCENCHGYESLHNIALDSDGNGFLEVGAEMPWYSHVGNSMDCEGCHRGYGAASAPGMGAIIPMISDADASTVIQGTDTVVTLTGIAFTNTSEGATYSSDAVVMTASDGTSVILTPSSVTESSLTVTIPAATAVGRYELRAEKTTDAMSNPVVISVIPNVAITGDNCNKKKGVLTVSGSGFGVQPAGSEDYINVQVDGQSVDIQSWSDTEIRANVSSCSKNAEIKVNATFGSASNSDGGSNGGGGKPDKPCKGKKC